MAYEDWGIVEDYDLIERPSNRLTEEWTETLEEAFGDTENVRKGREGEEFLLKVFKKWNWDTKHYPSDREKQTAGIDIAFRNPKWRYFYTCDVKNNMNNYGSIWVDTKWLYSDKLKADRIFHVNPETGWVAWYGVDDMRNYYMENFKGNKKVVCKGKTMYLQKHKIIDPKDRPNWIQSKQVKV